MNQKKASGGWITLIMGILFIVGSLAILFGNYEMIFGSNVSNINKLLREGSLDSNVGSYVEADFDAILENFAETTHKVNFIPVGKDQHYLAWMDDESFMAVSVKGKVVKEFERVMEETWNFLESDDAKLTDTPVHVKGKLVKLTGDLKKYYDEALDSWGIDSTYDIHYYAIDCTSSQLILIAGVGILLALGAIMLIAFASNRRAIRDAKLAAQYGINPAASFPTEYSTGSSESTWTEPEMVAQTTETVEVAAENATEQVAETVEVAAEQVAEEQ